MLGKLEVAVIASMILWCEWEVILLNFASLEHSVIPWFWVIHLFRTFLVTRADIYFPPELCGPKQALGSCCVTGDVGQGWSWNRSPFPYFPKKVRDGPVFLLLSLTLIYQPTLSFCLLWLCIAFLSPEDAIIHWHEKNGSSMNLRFSQSVFLWWGLYTLWPLEIILKSPILWIQNYWLLQIKWIFSALSFFYCAKICIIKICHFSHF